MKFTNKLIHYASEAAFAWKTGVGFGTRLKLISRTLRFHLSNMNASPRTENAPERFDLRVNGVRFPLWLRARGGDLFVFYEIFLSRCYDLGMASPPKGPLRIVDLGANVGITARYYDTLYPGSKFACVEPRPSNAKSLAANLAGMDAVVFEAAAGDRSGKARFDVSGDDWGGAMVSEGSDAKKTIEVSVLTMDEILDRAGFETVDILKIDIEGAEKELLRGNPAWLKKVCRIVIELHGDYSEEHFRADMATAGFETYPQRSQGNPMTVAVRR